MDYYLSETFVYDLTLSLTVFEYFMLPKSLEKSAKPQDTTRKAIIGVK